MLQDVLTQKHEVVLSGPEWDDNADAIVETALKFSGSVTFEAEAAMGSNVLEVTATWAPELQHSLLEQERREWCRAYEARLNEVFPGYTILWL